MSDASQRGKKSRVLSDHKQVGKRFIPPFLTQLSELDEIVWVDTRLPELVWLALLNKKHGLKRGAELAVELARAADKALNPTKKVWFGTISSYSLLGEEQAAEVVTSLKQGGQLEDLKSALEPLIRHYPECPLSFLFDLKPLPAANTDDLSEFKLVMEELFDKTSKPATLMQVNSLYIAFVTGKCTAAPGMSLTNFPAVVNYPDTDESQRVGALMRASVMSFFGSENDTARDWPKYFWNRGLEIDRCVIHDEVADD